MCPPNITILRKVMLKEQVPLLITSNKNYYHLLYYTYISNSKNLMQREKEESRVYHLGIDPPS
jgi:hypothetical protein